MRYPVIIFTALLLFTVSYLSAQNVGVDVASPLEKFDVDGAIKIGTDANNHVTNAPTGGEGTIRYRSNEFQGWNGTSWINLDIGADADWTLSGINQYSAVSGNVGIGTNGPDAKLDVYRSAGTTDLFITKDGSQASTLLFRNGTSGTAGTSLGLSTAEHFTIQNNISDKDIIINVNDGGVQKDMIFIDAANARVGIATNAPDAELEVGGQIKITGGTPGTDKVLRSDNTGLGTWVDPNTLIDNDLDWTISGPDQYSAVSGNVGVGTTSPDAKLDVYVSGGTTDMYITKDGSQASSLLFRNGTSGTIGTSLGLSTAEHFTLENAIPDKDIILSVNDGGIQTELVFLDASFGRVGIGTNTPEHLFTVDGDMGVNNSVFHNGDPNTFLSFTDDRIQFFAGSGSSSWIDIQNSASELTINENDLQRDFRVEGGVDENLLFVDGSADNVGIGTNSPGAKLEIAGQLKITGGSPGLDKVLRSDGVGLGTWVDPNTLPIDGNTLDEAYDEGGNGAGRTITADNGAVNIAGADGLHVEGFVGIGNTSPSAALHVRANSTTAQMVVEPLAVNAQDGIAVIRGARDNTAPSATSRLRFENYDNNGSPATTHVFGSINGIMTDGTNNIGELSFRNSADGTTLTETMRLTKDNEVKIGDLAGSGTRMVVADASGQLSTQSVPNGVPSGAVMYFNLAGCPTGWSEFTAGRGRYVVGKPNGGTLNGTAGTALTDTENRATGEHNHIVDPPSTTSSSDGNHTHKVRVEFGTSSNLNVGPPGQYNQVTNNAGYSQINTNGQISTDGAHTHSTDISQFNSGNSGSVAGTNAPYIQLLICQKD